jgi:hypothetical protein
MKCLSPAHFQTGIVGLNRTRGIDICACVVLHDVSRIRKNSFLFSSNFALQYHLLASYDVKILEVSAVVVYNFKEQALLHHVF